MQSRIRFFLHVAVGFLRSESQTTDNNARLSSQADIHEDLQHAEP